VSPFERPLAGLRVGLSVAGDPEDLARWGFTESGMNRLTVRLARALLAEGAGLAFGHDWREGGVMEAIASIALDYRGSSLLHASAPPILNYIPWPDSRSQAPADLLARLREIVEVQPAGLPASDSELEDRTRREGRESEAWRILRARGLSHMRRRLTEVCGARVAFGGKLKNFQGSLPGIVEEVFLALQASQPVYLAGLLGGAAEALGRVLVLGEKVETLPSPVPEEGTPGDSGPQAVLRFLGSPEARERLQLNGLRVDENRLLLSTTLEEEAIALILTGLHRVRKPAVNR
jgi:hypothetical protein